MIIVADSGSTKTNWALLCPKQPVFYFDTEGYNPYFTGSAYIVQSLSKNTPLSVNPATVSAVYFYGAGCFENKAGIVHAALQQFFFNAQVFVGLDLLGSARAVLGNQPGFVGILGTGTNSCLYNGEKITANRDSLGYLLGDEGSGFYIGRKILSDYIREDMPAPVREEFFNIYRLGREAIMEQVYSEKLPNRFCAGFTSFISKSVADKTYTSNLVKGCFVDFFENLVTKYPGYGQYTFNCTGSVGYYFREILAQVAAAYNMKTGVIIKTPIEGLAQHHFPANSCCGK
jgi:N-acetylglucosamine kinase-like BadF-type ATPase